MEGDGPAPGGGEDDFHSQFADELEVLAELEGASAPSPCRAPAAGRPRPTFEEAIAGEDAAGLRSPAGPPRGARKRPRDAADREGGPSPPTPKARRPRLEVAKRLNFGPEELEEPPLPASPRAITPPPSPEGPAAPWGDGPLDAGVRAELTQALPATRNPVLKRPPVLEDYINVTSTGGDRAFLALRTDPVGAGVQSPLLDVWWRDHSQLDLLGVPFSSLKEQVDSERRQRLLQEAQRLSDTLRSLRTELGAEAQSLVVSEEELEVAGGPDGSQHVLWVDEFAPQHYTELLSDDFTNRCLLKWLKLWDVVVFGREKPARKLRLSAEPPRAGKETMASSKWKNHEQVLEEMLEAELDPSQRPRQKVALLCGPPGLGKTTLAHVIARHAGYAVVEMNASDDRSPEAFRARIEAATQMESVLGASGRPNCLVIDEIDGAPTAAVNVLLSVLDRRAPQGPEPGAQSVSVGAGRRRREGGLLLRPVICICNDPFAPSLRQLKQQALLLHFPPTLQSRLVQRLLEISLKRGMQADPGVLAALCEKTDNDIRACVNTLQFLHGQGRRGLSLGTVQTTRIGLKDQRRGLFSAWQEVFQLPRAQRRQVGQDPAQPAHVLLGGDGDGGAGPPPTKEPLTAASQRFYHVLHVTSSTGEHEKLVQGLYDNFLRLRLRDPGLGAVCAALDWLAFDDVLACAAHHSQSFHLLRYLPFVPVAFHLLLASSHVPRLAFPSSQQEAQVRTSRTRTLVQTLLSGTTPATRSRAAPQALVLDTLCLLLDILAPKLRPVSTQLYSAREKQQLAALVDTMTAYSLNYRQERAPDGQYTYRLEPNVEEICRFPELPARKPLAYQAKQLIAREIDLEKMRRAEAEAPARAGPGPQLDGDPLRTEGRMGGREGRGGAHPNPRQHAQWLEHVVRRAAFEEQPERDFFGRVVVRRATPSPEDAAPEPAERLGAAVGRSDVWFRFNEGVSNAVRRGVYVRDLL